jgi:Na+/proline symporter
VYQRLVRPGASERELLVTARIATLALGALIVAGALFVGHFGGAFEANKLFTSLFAIPLAVPLLLGILLPGPRPWGTFASVLAGVGVGVYLNLHPEVSWPLATLVVIGVTIGAMLLSAAVPSRDTTYRERVSEFFRRLATPLREDETPRADPRFRYALAVLLSVALAASGLLFAGMSLLSIRELSGQLAMASGVVCLAVAGAVLYTARRKGDAAPAIAELQEAGGLGQTGKDRGCRAPGDNET